MEKYAIVIAGPSGAGKTSVADALIEKLGNLEMSRSATTRPRRGDGRDDEYVYLSVGEFEACISSGCVLEYTNYSGNFYGTRQIELDRIFENGKIPILVLDYNGARSLKERLGYPVYAFYIYTDLNEAEKRLIERDIYSCGSDKKKLETFTKRKMANIEDYLVLCDMAELFDAYVENDVLDCCVSKVALLIDELRHGREVMSSLEKRDITASFKKQAVEKSKIQ